MRKLYYTLLLIIVSYNSQAFVVWPNASAPCNGTLQACIDASAVGEYIEVRSNGPINENISTSTALSLVAGIGYQPLFSSGNSIEMNLTVGGAPRTIRIIGFTFVQGGIKVSTLGAPLTAIIESNTVQATAVNIPAIKVVSGSVLSTDVQIKYNRVFAETVGNTATAYGAILVNKNSIGVGEITGEIYNNTVESFGTFSKGISVFVSNNADLDINITANVVYGGTSGGIFINRFNSSTAVSDFDITSNAFYQYGTFYNPSGIHIINDAGTTNVDIINNTMIQSRDGIYLRNGVGTLDARLHNNLIAFGGRAINSQPSVSMINDNNLLYQNSLANIDYTPGGNDISTDPMIKSLSNARLSSDSPALDSGNLLAFLNALDAPLIDADGLVRIKNPTATGSAQLDIGAYEAGDFGFLHRNTNGGVNYISNINNSYLNGFSGLDSVHITSNWNPNGIGGTYNNENEAIYYSSGLWRIFNEGLVNMFDGASFNVSRLGSTGKTFEHTYTGSGENNTMIDDSGLNNNGDYILQVSQHWTGTYNPNPPGIFYFGGNWGIINMNLAVLPTNSNFNVYYQRKSKSAYEHIARTANIISNRTILDNPLINGVSCAQIQVTQSASQGVFNDAPIGVYYAWNRWRVFNQDMSAMPEDAAFHVLINPGQIADCTDIIFEDGFE
ncbi:hypothetical protein MNBD_GAMMA01-645 [hydrothermal vent metagenome]|uniref:DUF7452 domain-containing protein n=1 Tax=hydrothermal vent metagenome TaxID=652676 RepID=A0A3B0V1E4_9ZZZZ